MFKPTSGTSFGFGSGTTSTPFGQSGFGKMGSTNAFGSGAFGTTSTSMFGGQNQTSTGLFGQTSTTGQTAFGQPASTQSSGFAFGASNTSTNLFNPTQQQASGSLFGTAANTAFSQKPAFSGFGSTPSTGMFGAAQPTQPQVNPTPLFGQPNTGNTGLFGSTSAFGAANTQTGTVIKFTPVTGTDTITKNRVTQSISTRHHCITFMKEYEAKSFEELRIEDYLSNRKGPQQGTTTGNNLFASMSTPTAGNSSLFGSTPGVSQGFGQTPSVFGQSQMSNLFGQKPAFGTVASTSSPFSFNSSTTATPFGNTAAKPFGSSTPTTGLFSTSTTQSTNQFGQTNAFGNFGVQTSNATTGFLNQSKPTAITFNIQPNTTNTTGFGTFGQQQNNLFGGAKPATNVFGTSTAFGQTTTTKPTFGSFGQPQQQQQPSLLFNNPTMNKQTTAFGVTQPTNPGLLGGFGSGQNQTTTNIFSDNKNTSNFFGGTQPQTTTMPISGFGQNPTGTGFNPLGAINTQQTSLFPQQTTNIHEHIMTVVRSYPEIPFLKNILPSSANKSRTTNQVLLKEVLDDELKISNKSQKIVLKVQSHFPNQEMKTLFDGLDEQDSSLSENIFASKPRNPRRLYLKKFSKNSTKNSLELSDTILKDVSNIDKLNNSNNNNSSWISNCKTTDSPRSTNNSDVDNDKDQNNVNIGLNENSTPVSAINKEKTNKEFPETSKNSPSTTLSIYSSTNNSSKENAILSDINKDNVDDMNYINNSNNTVSSVPHPTGIICTRPGYYTIPSLDELAKMVTPDGQCIVENFTIGRRGYGNVYFPESFNVAGINIDECVHFRTKELIIYVDDDNKPPLGEELNRPAQVTLDQVYPRDRITRQLITDVDRLVEMDFESILRETCDRHGTEFIDYRPETGSWVFKVDHFTRYSFSDDQHVPIHVTTTSKKAQKTSEFVFKPKLNIPVVSGDIIVENGKEDNDLEEEIHSDDGESSILMPTTSTETDKMLFRNSSLSTIRDGMFVMRQAFFSDNGDTGSITSSQMSGGILTASSYVDYLTEGQRENYVKEFLTKVHQDPDLELDSAEQLDVMLRSKLEQEHLIDSEMVIASSETIPPESFDLIYPAPKIEPEYVSDDTLIHGTGFMELKDFLNVFQSTKCKIDISVFKANSFRTSFSKGNQFFIMNQWNKKFPSSEKSSTATSLLYENGEYQYKEIPDLLRLTFSFEDYKQVDIFVKNIQEHLLIQQAHSDIEIDSDGFPYIFPLEGPKALHEHSEKAQKHYKNNGEDDYIIHYSVHLWKLFEALWGEILELELEAPDNHFTTSTRRNYFSNWLEGYMEEILNVKKMINNDNLTIYDYIVAHKLLDASTFALQKCNLNLSLLITHLTPNIELRRYANNQITIWQTENYGKFIDKEIIKLYLLLAGLPVTIVNKNDKINVCENLNWLEAYALQLWYLTPLELTITDVTNNYIRAFTEDAYAEPPFPLYTYNQNEKMWTNTPIYDLIYHLLRLYSDRTYSLETLLNPTTYTIDPTDYSLSWLALQNLKALGYTHIREVSETKIHERFATQLEREGLWHWSLFILLHIKCSKHRKNLVINMINRNVSIDQNNDEYINRETFAIKELLIPEQYFSRAKGYRALFEMNYHAAINYFIASNDSKLVTKIFWKHIAPKEMMNRNYDYIKDLLDSMINGGYADDLHLIVHDFIQIITPIVQLFDRSKLENFKISQRIEDVTLSLSNICNKIITVKTNDKQQCLILSEISRDIVNYIKILVSNVDLKDRDSLAILAVWALKLPLPDDYVIEEIKNVASLLIQLVIDSTSSMSSSTVTNNI